MAQREFTHYFKPPRWEVHEVHEIWQTQLAVLREVLVHAGITASQVRALGITNQRETTELRDRQTGEPVAPAIVWQDRRTSGFCEALRAAGHAPGIAAKTGLVLDSYFSGTKLAWLLDHIPGARLRAERRELAFGTVDSWLLWQLTGGRVHATEASNASRMRLFNLENAVERARGCSPGGQWQGARRPQAAPLQRRATPPVPSRAVPSGA